MECKTILHYLITRLYWAHRFRAIGAHSVLYRPLIIINPKYIGIGTNTIIRDNSRLEVVIRTNVNTTPNLSIGNNVNIEQGVHIVCQGNIVIEDNVSITPYCVIVDTDHPHNDPDMMPKIGARLNSYENTHVRIGRGSFIGTHSVILPNVEIGLGCIIGAGSVVTSNVPNYCIATGAPARIVRRFNTKDRVWNTV